MGGRSPLALLTPAAGLGQLQAQLGDFTADFDFDQAPQLPLVLPLYPPPGPPSIPGG